LRFAVALLLLVEICISGLTTSAAVRASSASVYVITFEEGHHTFDQSVGNPYGHKDNKYLATVSVAKDGTVLVSGLRGSTLPDAPVFYRQWHADGTVYAPVDENIVTFFDTLEKSKQEAYGSLRSRGLGQPVGMGELRVIDNADYQRTLNAVPVLWSGEYRFAMGLHKNGQSIHGQPYVPRVLGRAAAQPFDARDPIYSPLWVGGFVSTINANKAQGHRHVAEGINIHDGRTDQQPLKDSVGCLTIHPDDWAKFLAPLPSPQAWSAAGHTGQVIIKRPMRRELKTNSTPRPNAPSNVRIIPPQ
jgi:hypothetical protein